MIAALPLYKIVGIVMVQLFDFKSIFGNKYKNY